MDQLTFRYEFDASYFDSKLTRNDFGRFSISVVTDRFSGHGGFWVQWQNVKEFGEALNVYPISPDNPIAEQWGFDMQEGDDLILRVEVAAADKRGNLRVSVEVADDYEPRNRVRTAFLTNYANLDAFREQIAKLMSNDLSEAVLTGQ